jgi:hypothetical protein
MSKYKIETHHLTKRRTNMTKLISILKPLIFMIGLLLSSASQVGWATSFFAHHKIYTMIDWNEQASVKSKPTIQSAKRESA